MNIERILVVDDHPIVLDGLLSMLETLRPAAELLTADCAADALSLTGETKFDWIFVDLNLPDFNGLTLIEKLHEQDVAAKIVVLSSEIEPKTIHDALTLKVDGVMSKASNRIVFEQCLMTIDMGQIFLGEQHAHELQNYQQGLLFEKSQIESKLNLRQLETLQLLVRGLSNSDIAKRLKISESTVKTHVSILLNAFQVSNRTRCVAEARRLGIVEE